MQWSSEGSKKSVEEAHAASRDAHLQIYRFTDSPSYLHIGIPVCCTNRVCRSSCHEDGGNKARSQALLELYPAALRKSRNILRGWGRH